MSDARTYVSAVVEESLGLVRGHLDRHPLPQDLVDLFAGMVRGKPSKDVTRPVLEDMMASLASRLREEALEEDGYFLRKARWPAAAPFAVCLTHDVDNLKRPTAHLWRTRSRFAPSDILGGILRIVNPYDNVRDICDGEGRQGFRSSFYFLTTNYPLGKVRTFSDRVRADGWDIGLHGDFGTHDSLEKMNEALVRFRDGLGFRPAGLREHFLRFEFTKSWEVMEAAGFDYDTTVGTNDTLGFKVGLATPFHPPSLDWAPMNLLELPLTLMDTTLWGYMKRTEEEGLADSMRLVGAVRSVEGLLTLLWHQEAVRMKGGRLYWRLLREFKNMGCYVGSGAEVSRWWREREVPLERDDRLIRFGGAPPRHLTLKLDLASGRSLKLKGAAIDGAGPTRRLVSLAREFQMEVS